MVEGSLGLLAVSRSRRRPTESKGAGGTDVSRRDGIQRDDESGCPERMLKSTLFRIRRFRNASTSSEVDMMCGGCEGIAGLDDRIRET